MNGASVSTVLQRSEPKWQNTCAVEYLNDCQLLVTVGKGEKKKTKKNFVMFQVASPRDCETG